MAEVGGLVFHANVPMIIPAMLHIRPVNKEGTSVSVKLPAIYPRVPSMMERMVPASLERFQYRPAVRGTKRETRLSTDEEATSS